MRDNFLILIIAIFLIWLGVSPKGRMIYLVLMGRQGEIAGIGAGLNLSSAAGAGGGFSAGGGKGGGGTGGGAG